MLLYCRELPLDPTARLRLGGQVVGRVSGDDMAADRARPLRYPVLASARVVGVRIDGQFRQRGQARPNDLRSLEKVDEAEASSVTPSI